MGWEDGSLGQVLHEDLSSIPQTHVKRSLVLAQCEI